MRGRKLGRKGTAVAQDAQVIAKLSALITAAQARHDAMLAKGQAAEERIAVLEAKVVILTAMLDAKDEMLAAVTTAVDRETFPPLGCELCQGGWVDEIDCETGEVYRHRCPYC